MITQRRPRPLRPGPAFLYIALLESEQPAAVGSPGIKEYHTRARPALVRRSK